MDLSSSKTLAHWSRLRSPPYGRTDRALVRAFWVALVLLSCSGRGAQRPEATGPITERRSSSAEREKVSITVYNQNFGLVREVRKVALAKGRVALEFSDVSANIQPETVHLKSLDDASALSVLEQNYRYDLLTPEKLLEKYVGKKVKVYRWNEATGKDDAFDAEVLSVEGGAVLRIGGEITAGFPGRIAFPEVPDNLIPKPTLVWLLASGAERQRVELTYLTENLNWRADYVLALDPTDTKGDLTGWVTLSNTTGTSYENAQLKLVAGDVQRITEDVEEYDEEKPRAPGAGRDRQFREESFFEYHLYTLERPTTLLDKEQKQVTLLEAQGVGIRKKLRYYGHEHFFRGDYGTVVKNQKVGVYLDIDNSRRNGLGLPLPKGTVRVYKADASGARQFIGENAIDHTPRDEEIKVKIGEAFDVIGDRTQTDWKALGECSSESAWSIEIRNHKDKPERVEVYEPAGGDWEVILESHPHKKEDARTLVFDIQVPARGETTVTYRVRVRWC